MLDIAVLMKSSFATAQEKGFWDKPRNVGEIAALWHSEVSEMFEEYRKHGLDPDKFIYYATGNPSKPEGIAVEAADLIIRVCDFCAGFGIDLEKAIELKAAYNATRQHMHGKVC